MKSTEDNLQNFIYMAVTKTQQATDKCLDPNQLCNHYRVWGEGSISQLIEVQMGLYKNEGAFSYIWVNQLQRSRK